MLADLLYRLRSLFRRRSVEAGLDDELQFHLERQAEKFRAAGLAPDEALRRARIALGGPEQVREECRDAWGTRWVQDALQDGQYAFRMLRQNPAFAAAAILSLALGIGANTSIFTVLDAVMLKPLPVPEPERLVELIRQEGHPEGVLKHGSEDDTFTYPLWEQIRDRQAVFSGVFAYGKAGFDMSAGGEKRPLHGLLVSADYFNTLGVPALLGRTFTVADDQRKAGSSAAVAVLSYGFWQREFGGDSRVLERTIRLEGHPFQVIGVTPPEFFGVNVGETFDVAVPMTSDSLFHPDDNRALEGRSYWWLNIVGRLKKDVNPQQAAAQLKVISPSVFQAAVPTDFKPESQRNFLRNKLALNSVTRGLSDLRDRYGAGLMLLMGMVGVVLLIACANVANLLLARAGARQREVAVRMAIGAGRGRLIRQLLTESVVISILGAAAGLLFAFWSSRLFVGLMSTHREPRFLDLTPDLRVIAFTIAVATLTGILFGLAPALQAAHSSFSHALKEGAVTHSRRQIGRWGLGRILVAVQVALSLVLLVGAGLFVGTLRKLLTEDMGFRHEGILLVDPDLQTGQFPPQRQAVIADELLERLRSLPAVKSVARSVITPIQGGSWQWDVRADSSGTSQRSVHCLFNLVSPGYFQTLGTPLLTGRDFTGRDTKASPLVAILNETAARKLFPGTNPIGRIYHDEVPDAHGPKQVLVEIVGVAKDAKYLRLRDEMPATIYLPISQNPAPFAVVGTYELHFAGSSIDLVTGVKKVLGTIDPRLSVEFHLLSVQVADSLLQEKLLATLAGFFGLLALLLASVGLYGVVAYTVTRRRNEIGIRMALGAARGSVLWLVLRELAVLLLVGVILGISGSLACTRFVRAMLYGLTPSDPSTLAGACLLLLVVATIAAYFPARSATRVDPLAALRDE